MAGITFLSGGQSEEEATQHIQAMAEYMPDAPWNVSFSFARALQSSVLKTWGGKPENKAKAQEMLRAVCQVNGLAQMGQYKGESRLAVTRRPRAPSTRRGTSTRYVLSRGNECRHTFSTNIFCLQGGGSLDARKYFSEDTEIKYKKQPISVFT